MEWKKFVNMWQTTIGEMPPKETWHSFEQYVSAVASDSIMIDALKELAEPYHKIRNTDSFKKPPTLWQLQDAVSRQATAAAKPEEIHCRRCENSGTVYVIDNGRYSDDDFPPELSAPFQRGESTCVVPCPECQKEKYSGNEKLRLRVVNRSLPPSRRDDIAPYRRIMKSAEVSA